MTISKWWHRLWTTQDPEEPIIEFIVDLTTPTPVMISYFVVAFLAFLVWTGYLEWTFRRGVHTEDLTERDQDAEIDF